MDANLVGFVVQAASLKRQLDSQRLLALLLLPPPLNLPQETGLPYLDGLEGWSMCVVYRVVLCLFFLLFFAVVSFVESTEYSLFELPPFFVGLDSWFFEPPE